MSPMTPSGRAATAALAFLLATSGCGDPTGGGSAGTADCPDRIRCEGAVFTSYGYTSRAGRGHGSALEAVCEDTGNDARGSVFTDESRLVATYRFAGYPPSEVLGVKIGRIDGLAVFVADSVSAEERDRIYRELERPEG